MLGLAVGDALGAAVEFDSLEEIREQYGPRGIEDLVAWGDFPVGSFTDDTQMSMATAEGLLDAVGGGRAPDVHAVRNAVHRRYLEWLRSQEDPNLRRAPGMTTVNALRSGHAGSTSHQLNYSKGCGGVMRVAPVGLAFSGEHSFEVAAECAALTHGHPAGYLSAGFLAQLIGCIIADDDLERGITVTRETLQRWDRHDETLLAVDRALKLMERSGSTADAIAQIGGGWVGEEALGIALYCSLAFRDDWQAAVTAAVNHSGDSDSTGSICGAIMGALHGDREIPERWIARVEDRARLVDLAHRLHAAFGKSMT